MEKNAETKLMRDAHDARLVHINEQVIMPLLNQRIDIALSQLCSDFQAGKPPNINLIATIATAKDLIYELDSISRRGTSAANKLQQQEQE